MSIASLDIAFYTAIFLLPGFFMRNIIAALIPARKTNDNFTFLTCLMYSIINLAVWSWAYVLITHIRNIRCIADWIYWVVLVAITLIGATVTAFVIGAIIQKKIIWRLGNIFGLKTIDPIDTAWDELFFRCENFQLLITLKDDSKVCGWYAYDSFTSSDANDRDIYIQYTYKEDENGKYQPDPESRGIYIPKESIKYIEIKQPKEVEKNEQ